jgi:rRNA maturation endonuclease Nob1
MSTGSGRSLRDVALVVGETRRLVGVERSYRCEGCGGKHRSWSRLRACPTCGERLPVAVIRRAAFA